MDVTFSDKGGHGVTEESAPYTKTIAGQSASHYLVTKGRSEEIALSSDNANGLRVIALRPGGIFGPRESFFSYKIFLAGLLTGYHPVYIAPQNLSPHKADFTFVYNIVFAHMLAVDRVEKSKNGS